MEGLTLPRSQYTIKVIQITPLITSIHQAPTNILARENNHRKQLEQKRKWERQQRAAAKRRKGDDDDDDDEDDDQGDRSGKRKKDDDSDYRPSKKQLKKADKRGDK